MPASISKAAIERARAFVRANARPLDRAYLDYMSPSGGDETAFDRVIGELERYQTPEGGFGNAIEPDIRSPAPSAIGTSIAFQYLRAIGAPADLPMVRRAIDYLVRTVDRTAWVWPAVDARVDEGPHAPWWAPGLDRFRGYVFNPTAELLGYLYDYRADVPGEVLQGVTSTVLEALDRVGRLDSAYELYCCMRLIHTKALPADVRDFLEQRLPVSLVAADPDDPHLNLMRIAPTPSSFGYELVRDGLARQAERLIASQGDDGGWRPGWEPWHAKAHQEWAGEITCRALVGLAAHGFWAD